MKVIGIVALTVVALAAATMGAVGMLARRVVGVKPRRKSLRAERTGDLVMLPANELTEARGNYGLWFGRSFEHHALVGRVVSTNGHHVVRRVVKTTAPMAAGQFQAQWTGHTSSGPEEIDPQWKNVAVPLRDGTSAPAWLFPGRTTDAPWVIHVQGIRTSRNVTLRSVEVAHDAGLTSLAISYRGAGDGPPASASTLGQREWTDLADAVSYVRSRGATAVYVVAWSMGAGLALELLRHDSHAIDRLALIAPATNWRLIIRNGVTHTGLPSFAAHLVTRALSAPLASQLLGLARPLDFNRLDWGQGVQLNLPLLVVHSDGDREIPVELTIRFVAANSQAEFVKTAAAPHGWEANVDPETFRSALRRWLTRTEPIDMSG